jgi:hypothetical protein
MAPPVGEIPTSTVTGSGGSGDPAAHSQPEGRLVWRDRAMPTAGWLSAGDQGVLASGGLLDWYAVPVPSSARCWGLSTLLSCGFWLGVTNWGCLLSIRCLAREPEGVVIDVSPMTRDVSL